MALIQGVIDEQCSKDTSLSSSLIFNFLVAEFMSILIFCFLITRLSGKMYHKQACHDELSLIILFEGLSALILLIS